MLNLLGLRLPTLRQTATFGRFLWSYLVCTRQDIFLVDGREHFPMANYSTIENEGRRTDEERGRSTFNEGFISRYSHFSMPHTDRVDVGDHIKKGRRTS